MMNKLFILLLFFVVTLCFSHQVYAQEKAGQSISLNTDTDKRICNVIADNIRKGINIKKIIKTGIQMGYNGCSVVKCAIQNRGDVSQVVAGAVEAGMTPDVISKCAIEAGAKPGDVAGALSNVSLPGICFNMPEKPDAIISPRAPVISPTR